MTIHRKVQANLSILTSSVWTWLVPMCLAFVTFLLLRRTGYLHRLQRRVPGVRACLLGAVDRRDSWGSPSTTPGWRSPR